MKTPISFNEEVITLAEKTEKLAQTIRFDMKLIEKIDQYKEENFISTRQAAIIQLINLGLKTSK